MKARVSILGTVKQCHTYERLDTIQKMELLTQKQNGNQSFFFFMLLLCLKTALHYLINNNVCLSLPYYCKCSFFQKLTEEDEYKPQLSGVTCVVDAY